MSRGVKIQWVGGWYTMGRRGLKYHGQESRYRGGAHPARAPPKIRKNMIFWRKIVIFHTKYHNNFRASLRSGISTPYPLYLDPPTHGILTPHPWYFDSLPTCMVISTPYWWYIEPPVAGDSENSLEIWTLPFFRSEKARTVGLNHFEWQKKMRKFGLCHFLGRKKCEIWTL
jgi:hypothetical protein